MPSFKNWCYAAWLLVICGFTALHAVHLRADFPNHTQWFSDWAKYTDEGWYGNAAIRAHLFGNWYLPGDFNPAPAVPVWPFLEWMLFFFTRVTVEAARSLALAFFFLNLLLSYWLLRVRGPRWMALLVLTLMVTSPFLYAFSRLAILEPLLTTLMLAAMNLAVRLPRMRRQLIASASIGLLFTLMMLTKSTAVFLLPALVWCMILPLWKRRRVMWQSLACAAAAFAISFGTWIAFVMHRGLWDDYTYLFVVNKYVKPTEWYWPLTSLWWSTHGLLWMDSILAPIAVLVVIGVLIKSRSARSLLLDPVFGASVLAIAGYILFMTVQNHPQPRYFAVVAVFCFSIVAQGAGALVSAVDALNWVKTASSKSAVAIVFLLVVSASVGLNGARTLDFALHPEYTFVDSVQRLVRYIDEHPNGKRLLASVSGDEISLITPIATVNDLFGTATPAIADLGSKYIYYKPGWYATWNTLDPGSLEDLHCYGYVEQVASFHTFDDPRRNVLILFKVHPWPGGALRDPSEEPLNIRLPEDRFSIPLE